MLEPDLGRQAKKFLDRVPPKHARQLREKIHALLITPYPQDAKMLFGFPYWRVDSGEYRIVYKVAGSFLVVRIVGKRNDDDVYRRLERLED